MTGASRAQRPFACYTQAMRRGALAMSAALALWLAPGCSVVAGWYGSLGSFLGSNSTDSCDRRFGAKPQPFCKEIDDTVAGSQFRDDCRKKFGALAQDAPCPRAAVVGGCHLDQKNEDGSQVTDWYYDVSPLIGDAGEGDGGDGGEGDDGGASEGGFAPNDVGLTADDVRARCADPSRYQGGAHFVAP